MVKGRAPIKGERAEEGGGVPFRGSCQPPLGLRHSPKEKEKLSGDFRSSYLSRISVIATWRKSCGGGVLKAKRHMESGREA